MVICKLNINVLSKNYPIDNKIERTQVIHFPIIIYGVYIAQAIGGAWHVRIHPIGVTWHFQKVIENLKFKKYFISELVYSLKKYKFSHSPRLWVIWQLGWAVSDFDDSLWSCRDETQIIFSAWPLLIMNKRILWLFTTIFFKVNPSRDD